MQAIHPTPAIAWATLREEPGDEVLCSLVDVATEHAENIRGNLPHAMSSNSLRISGDLFDQALRQGAVLSRSAAQQLEHWARLGAAVEASGLTVPQLVALLQGRVTPPSPVAEGAAAEATALLTASEPEAQLWSVKRARQQRDLANIADGGSDNEAMSWFSGGVAKRAKAVDSPF